MPNIRSESMKKYDISVHRFLELYHYCMQYNEWKEELDKDVSNIKSAEVTDMPVAHNQTDPTSSIAIRRQQIADKCKLIEQTAIEADAALYPYILEAVTNEGVTYRYLKMIREIPCGKKMYYDRRRRFYWLLSKKI